MYICISICRYISPRKRSSSSPATFLLEILDPSSCCLATLFWWFLGQLDRFTDLTQRHRTQHSRRALRWLGAVADAYWMVGKLYVTPNGSPLNREYVGNLDTLLVSLPQNRWIEAEWCFQSIPKGHLEI